MAQYVVCVHHLFICASDQQQHALEEMQILATRTVFFCFVQLTCHHVKIGLVHTNYMLINDSPEFNSRNSFETWCRHNLIKQAHIKCHMTRIVFQSNYCLKSAYW